MRTDYTGEQKTEFVNELVDWFVGRGHLRLKNGT